MSLADQLRISASPLGFPTCAQCLTAPVRAILERIKTAGLKGSTLTKKRTTTKLHIDREKVQLQKDAERIIHEGTLDEFKAMLRKAGIDPESAKGKELVDRLIKLGASGRSPR